MDRSFVGLGYFFLSDLVLCLDVSDKIQAPFSTCADVFKVMICSGKLPFIIVFIVPL